MSEVKTTFDKVKEIVIEQLDVAEDAVKENASFASGFRCRLS